MNRRPNIQTGAVSVGLTDYINHEDAGRWRVKGSYYYDKYRTPIPLEGIRDANGNMTLCEGSRFISFSDPNLFNKHKKNTISRCSLHIIISGKAVTGEWSHNHEKLPIHLKQVGYLNNTGLVKPVLRGSVRIPLWYYTKKYLLIGVYKITSNCRATSMTNLILINRDDGSHYRNISLGCEFGRVATVVYMNAYHSSKRGFITLLATGGYHGMGRDVDISVNP